MQNKPNFQNVQMVVTAVYTTTNNNEQRTTNYSKQTQSHPILSASGGFKRQVFGLWLCFCVDVLGAMFAESFLQAWQQVVFHHYLPVHISCKPVPCLNHIFNFGFAFRQALDYLHCNLFANACFYLAAHRPVNMQQVFDTCLYRYDIVIPALPFVIPAKARIQVSIVSIIMFLRFSLLAMSLTKPAHPQILLTTHIPPKVNGSSWEIPNGS